MSSNGPSSRLIIASSAPLRFAITGNDAAGCTCNDEPMTMNTFACSVHPCAMRIACSGIAWPKDTVADLSMPPQLSHLGEAKSPTKQIDNRLRLELLGAAHAKNLAIRTMQLDDLVVRQPSSAVQAVDILRDQADQLFFQH